MLSVTFLSKGIEPHLLIAEETGGQEVILYVVLDLYRPHSYKLS